MWGGEEGGRGCFVRQPDSTCYSCFPLYHSNNASNNAESVVSDSEHYVCAWAYVLGLLIDDLLTVCFARVQ